MNLKRMIRAKEMIKQMKEDMWRDITPKMRDLGLTDEQIKGVRRLFEG